MDINAGSMSRLVSIVETYRRENSKLTEQLAKITEEVGTSGC